jgi:hypothetical protein
MEFVGFSSGETVGIAEAANFDAKTMRKIRRVEVAAKDPLPIYLQYLISCVFLTHFFCFNYFWPSDSSHQKATLTVIS